MEETAHGRSMEIPGGFRHEPPIPSVRYEIVPAARTYLASVDENGLGEEGNAYRNMMCSFQRIQAGQGKRTTLELLEEWEGDCRPVVVPWVPSNRSTQTTARSNATPIFASTEILTETMYFICTRYQAVSLKRKNLFHIYVYIWRPTGSN